MGNAISFQLVRIGATEYSVSIQFGCDNLTYDIAIGKTNDKSILWCIVFVLCLSDEAFASIVVGFTFSPSLIFDLISPFSQLISTSKHL